MSQAIIISIDDFKKTIPGYNPNRAALVHRQSAKMADAEFDRQLKQSDYKKVILIGGGSASGKTEFINAHLYEEDAIIFDSTFSSVIGAEIKIKKILKAKKAIEVVIIIPENLKQAYWAFLGRDRKFESEVFYRTHSGCRAVCAWLIQNYPNIPLRLIVSRFSGKKVIYKEADYSSKQELFDYIKRIQMTEQEIRKAINYEI